MNTDLHKTEKIDTNQNDTISIIAHKDKKLMFQATNLKDQLTDIASNSKSAKFSISIINLQRKLNRFIETFSTYTEKFVNEKEKRNLPNINFTESKISSDFIHQIVKFQEELKDCTFRHNDIDLVQTSTELNKKLDKFILSFSKYSAMIGTSPIDKPISHDVVSELEH